MSLIYIFWSCIDYEKLLLLLSLNVFCFSFCEVDEKIIYVLLMTLKPLKTKRSEGVELSKMCFRV